MNINLSTMLSTIIPAALNFLAMLLSAWQMAEIIAKHGGPFDIFTRLREWNARRIQSSSRPNRAGLFQCSFCLAPWTAAIALALWHFNFPYLNWAMAVSWSYGASMILLRRMLPASSQPRREWTREMLIGQDANGRVEVRRNDFSAEEQLNIFATFAGNLMTAIREANGGGNTPTLDATTTPAAPTATSEGQSSHAV